MKTVLADLSGQFVHLEPLHESHAEGLYSCGQEADDWRYMPRACFEDLADTRQWITEAQQQAQQTPFTIVESAHGRAVGSTRYMACSPLHRRVEIGYTWLGREWQRTPINTETKLLLLRHAFAHMQMLRVEFKTDARNLRSQRALERLGAVREGVMRQHMQTRSGGQRDSVYYSIVRNEWPETEQRLTKLLLSA